MVSLGSPATKSKSSTTIAQQSLIFPNSRFLAFKIWGGNKRSHNWTYCHLLSFACRVNGPWPICSMNFRVNGPAHTRRLFHCTRQFLGQTGPGRPIHSADRLSNKRGRPIDFEQMVQDICICPDTPDLIVLMNRACTIQSPSSSLSSRTQFFSFPNGPHQFWPRAWQITLIDLREYSSKISRGSQTAHI